MTSITDDLIETLLNESEGEALDFKRDQYRFRGASDAEKGELLKDILAFANAWRRSDAFILIGVDEVVSGPAQLRGVKEHLDDAELQQFVSSKTQRPVRFRYAPRDYHGVSLGVIQIPEQQRPVFLTKDYGRLRRNEVYIRRGSATGVASPDEASKMGPPLTSEEQPALAFISELLSVHNIDHIHWVSAAVGVANQGAGSAKSPYVEIDIPEACKWASYGLDGNGNDGLVRVPRAHEARSRAYGGTPDVVIHPGTKRMITKVDIRVPQGTKDVPELRIPYSISAEGMAPVSGEHEIQRDEVLSRIE